MARCVSDPVHSACDAVLCEPMYPTSDYPAPNEANEPFCRCGHPLIAHKHYRAGTECALCLDCPQFRVGDPPGLERDSG